MRVVAGRLGGRVLRAPPGSSTRPTGARVKEALFAILGDLHSARVLDLYAGSGALGIEALSRGAQSAVFVEAARPALACLRRNLEELALSEHARVLAMRVEACLPALRPLGPFDLLLCDPPWREVQAARAALEALAQAGLLAPGARVVLEHSAKDPAEEQSTEQLLKAVDRRRWGDTAVTLLLQASEPEPAHAPNPSGQPGTERESET